MTGISDCDGADGAFYPCLIFQPTIPRQSLVLLELIGIKTVKDTMFSMRQGAVVCSTGVLGKVYEWNHFDPIKDIPNGVYLTGFFSNYPDAQIMETLFFLKIRNISSLIPTSLCP